MNIPIVKYQKIEQPQGYANHHYFGRKRYFS